MNRMIIVDDESISADGMAMLVKSSQLDIQVAGVFYSSLQALDYLQNHSVDIVLTDINMPGLSGLELIAKIRESNATAQLMILTGFGSLDYAKQAMRYGVKYFLQKPISPEEFQSSLTQCLLDLKQVTQETILSRKQVIDNVLLGQGIVQDGFPEFTLLMYQDRYSKVLHEPMMTALEGMKCSAVFSNIHGAIVYYVFGQLEDIDLNDVLVDKLGDQLTSAVVYCKFHVDLKGVIAAYNNGNQIFPLNFYFNRVHLFTSLPNSNYTQSELLTILTEIKLRISSNEFSEVKRLSQQLFRDVQLNLYSPKDLKQTIYSFWQDAFQVFSDEFNETSTELQEQIIGAGDIEELQVAWHKNLIFFENQIESSKMKNTISANLNWLIEKYYGSSELSLRWISKNKLFLNPEYLGKVYQKEAGQKFSQKLFDVRMVKAKELLVHGYKVYEVAEMIGYGKAPDYFSQIFKKRFGYTPRQYVTGQEHNQ